MIQREVKDKENVQWTCVQTYTGMQENLSEKAAELLENGDGKVTVVCTPTGGAQTVRLELPVNWHEQVDEEKLVESIAQAQK